MTKHLLALFIACFIITGSFAQAPTITSFTPTKAGAGATITINGTNFTGATSVSFGVSARSFTVNSPTQITAVVNSSAVSGNITVSTPAGNATAPGFVFELVPTVSNFTPVLGGAGQQVTIYGTNLQDATAVSFGGTPAASFTATSTSISAVVGSGSSGNVVVTTPGGTVTLPGFTYAQASQTPTITSFAPNTGTTQSSIVITGTNLNSVSGVSFGGTPASSFTINSETQITAILGAGASGNIALTSTKGTASLAGFTYVAPPSVTSFFPNSITSTQGLVISGSGFSGVTGVSFGGIPASAFTIVSPNQINATAGYGTSGTITLTAYGQTFSAAGFLTVIADQGTPTINSYSTLFGTAGTNVSINGTNLGGATAVKFGGTDAASFSVISSNQVNAVVGAGSSGNITIITPHGGATISGFTYQPSAPTIGSFSPTSATQGQTVTITGTNFNNVSAVNFGGTLAKSFTVNSSTSITAVVDSCASGAVTVTNNGGTATSNGFTYIKGPVITSFSPTSAATGQSVVMTGFNFTGATSVYFSGVAASSFTVNSPTQITAVVANGATGGIAVNTPNGNGTAGGFTYKSSSNSPTITSFSPTTAPYGGSVVITGTNLSGVNSVNFGGVPAASFTVNSPTQITAVVKGGSSGTIDIASFTGTASAAGFTFSTAAPAITSFAPASAAAGDTVVITGTALSAVTSVYFGGAVAKSFKVNSATQITAVVGNGASGSISASGANGSVSQPGFTFNGLIAPPVITSFSPHTASVGGMVTINGTNLGNTTAVAFGASSIGTTFTSTPTQIIATVGSAATTGSVTVATQGGYSSVVGFTLDTTGISPIISSFAPTSAKTGDTVIITGTGLTGTSALTFGGIPAASFKVNSATQIMAIVGNGASGNISITNTNGTYAKGGFTFIQAPLAPVITSFSPTNASTDDRVIISGNNFSYVNAVSFGGTPAASYTINSDTQITALVGSGTSGNILVKSSYNGRDSTATIAGFVYGTNATPTLTSFSPTTAKTGDTVLISGTNLSAVSAVSFGGTAAASFTIVSPLQIKAVVGTGATGNLRLTIPSGNLTGGVLTYLPQPAVSTFTPASAGPGTIVTITGTNFANITGVSFGGVPAYSFTVNSPTLITAEVNNGSANGNIAITSLGGNATIAGFTFVPPAANAPTVLSFTPATGGAQTSVTVTGTNFSNATAVNFGGVAASSFTVNSPTSITAVTGVKQSGPITVTTANGTGTSGNYFVFSVPTVTSFTPVTASTGDTVTITGTNFGGVDSVYFGLTSATSFRINSPTNITAIVGSGATGQVVVKSSNNTGVGLQSGFTFVPSTSAVITSFSPTSAGTGTTVVIKGRNLSGVTAVSFGGVAATSFTINSSTQISAVVGAGAGGNIQITSPNGNVTIYGFTYVTGPAITGISPTVLSPGMTFTLTGANFTGVTRVSLASNNLRHFTVVSPTTITAVVDTINGISFPEGVNVLVNTNQSNSFQNLTIVPIAIISVNGQQSTSIIQGNSASLTIPFGNNLPGCTQQWQKDGVDIPGATGATYTATLAGSYTLKLTSGTVTTVSDAVVITVIIPKPTLTSASTLTAKQGDVITLTGTYLTGTTAVSFGGVAASAFTVNSATSIIATVGAGGSGTILASNGIDTAKLSGFNFVPVPTIAVPGSTTILSTQTVTLSASPATGFSYQWMKDGVAISGATNATYTTNLGGQYTVVISLNGVIQLAAPVVITSIFDLPANEFTVKTISATCKGSSNGFIVVKAAQTGTYTALVTGGILNNKSFSFTDSLQVTNLAAGTYNICMGVTGQPNYSKCFTVVIGEPKDLSVYVAAITPNNQVTLALSGSESYFITLNGVATTTTQSQVTLQLSKGKNTILINTDKDCQGVIEKDITVGQDIPYPNPFSNQISINLGPDVVKSVVITVTDLFGKPVYSTKYTNAIGTVTLDLSSLKNGVYLFNLSADNVTNLFKIMKQ